jgi:hypothetical protein
LTWLWMHARTKGWFNLSMIRCDLTWTPALLPVSNYEAKGVFGRASHSFGLKKMINS